MWFNVPGQRQVAVLRSGRREDAQAINPDCLATSGGQSTANDASRFQRIGGVVGQKEKRSVEDAPFFSGQLQPNQVQVITPLVISQTFAVCVCDAVALHDGGGPATAVTTTVTFCDGLKPWRGAADVAVPEK